MSGIVRLVGGTTLGLAYGLNAAEGGLQCWPHTHTDMKSRVQYWLLECLLQPHELLGAYFCPRISSVSHTVDLVNLSAFRLSRSAGLQVVLNDDPPQAFNDLSIVVVASVLRI